MSLNFQKYNNPEILDHTMNLLATPSKLPALIVRKLLFLFPFLLLEIGLSLYLLWPHYWFALLLTPIFILFHLIRSFTWALKKAIQSASLSIHECIGFISQISNAIHSDFKIIFDKHQHYHEKTEQINLPELINIKQFVSGISEEIIKPNLVQAVNKKIPIFKKPVQKILTLGVDTSLNLAEKPLNHIDSKLQEKLTPKLTQTQEKIDDSLESIQNRMNQFNDWSVSLNQGLNTISEISQNAIQYSTRKVLWPFKMAIYGSFLIPVTLISAIAFL